VAAKTNEKQRDVAVLIVAYKSADKLRMCLDAVARHLPCCAIYVWDNSGPSDSSVRAIAADFLDVRWTTGSENIGFAAAVNRLAAMAPECDMLLLNPDAELLCAIPRTLDAINAPGVAAAAPMVECAEAERRPMSAAPAPWDVAHRPISLANAYFAVALPPQRLRGTSLSDLYRTAPCTVSGYLTGACLAIRRDAWESVGPLDERFFLYGEEADWQSRARTAGWTLRLTSEAGVRHAAQGTVKGDSQASMRSSDLVRAGVALQLEYRYGRLVADTFLVAASITEHTKLRFRSPGSRAAPLQDIMITIDNDAAPESVSQAVELAKRLNDAGQRVLVVSLGPLGELPRVIPSPVRLLRRPAWWPSTGPVRTPAVLAAGESRKQRLFAWLYGRRARRSVVPLAALAVSMAPDGRTEVDKNRTGRT
jgi:GT2 family glycosyltransferase